MKKVKIVVLIPMKKGENMKIKDILAAESGSIKVVKKGDDVLLSVNEHDLVTLSEDEFLDLCVCCSLLGQKLLQDKELELQKRLLEISK